MIYKVKHFQSTLYKWHVINGNSSTDDDDDDDENDIFNNIDNKSENCSYACAKM